MGWGESWDGIAQAKLELVSSSFEVNSSIKIGDKVKVTQNSIFKMMGYDEVTGIVKCMHKDNSGFSILCDQTNAYEGLDFNDGKIEVLT